MTPSRLCREDSAARGQRYGKEYTPGLPLDL